MKFVPLEEAANEQPTLKFVPLEAETTEPTKAEAKPTPTPTVAPKPEPEIDPTTGKPYPELRALPEPSVWDKLWAYATRNETIENKAKAANEYAARKYAAENKVPLSEAYKVTKDSHRPVFNPEGRASLGAAKESAVAAFTSLADMPESVANSTLRAIRGGDVPVKDRTWLDRGITATTQAPRQGDRNVESFSNIGQSLGYSVTTMVATALSDVVGGPYAAGTVGLAVPYRASKDEFLSRLRDNLDTQANKLYGKPLSEKQWGKAREDFEDAAVKYGAWEAVPEAVSNLIMLKAFTAPLRTVNSAEKAAEIAKRGVASQVAEQGTETITALGQNREELRAGLTKEELSIADAFRQQFVQTLATTGGLAAGAKGVQQVNKFYETYVEPTVRPGSALARAIQSDLNSYLEQQVPAEKAPLRFVPLAAMEVPAVPEAPRPELTALQKARKPELETEAPPDRTLSALERARKPELETEAPTGPTLSALEAARAPELEGAPITPPIEERVQAKALEYERQGHMADDARLLAERDVSAEMRSGVVGRAVQRQNAEDERRTAEGRAERAAMSMEAPSALPEPPSYVTQPSTDEFGTPMPSGEAGAAGRPVSAFTRGLDIARGASGELNVREERERAALDANKQRFATAISQAFNREALPDLGPILGASWTRNELAKNPTPEEYQEAAYARLEELDGQRPDDAGVSFERGAAPTVAAREPAVAPAKAPEAAAPAKVEEPVAPKATEAVKQRTVEELEAEREALKKQVEPIARANAIAAVDDALSLAETGGYSLESAIEEYRQNVFDTIDEEGITDPRAKEYADRAFDRILEELQRGTKAPKAVEAKEERPAKPAAPAAPAVTEAPLELEASRREDLETEQPVVAAVRESEKAVTKAGTPRQRAPGAGRKKAEGAKTGEERSKQSAALNKFNRDVKLLIAKANEFSERQSIETFQTPEEFEYKEALRDMYADQLRMAIYGVAQKSGMAQGYIDAKDYVRKMKPALRDRAKALWEGTAKLEDYHELPPKPVELVEKERKSEEYRKARAEGKAQRDLEEQTIHSQLDETEKQTVAEHYGSDSYDKVKDKFVADVIKAMNEGLESVAEALRGIIRKLQAGVLAAIIAVNPNFMSSPIPVAIPRTTVTYEMVQATVPAEVRDSLSPAAQQAYAVIYPAIKAELKAKNKLFVLTDKPNARVVVFTPDGKPILDKKVLLGLQEKDFYTGNVDLPSNRITPAGLFTLGLRDAARGGSDAKTAGHYDFGKVFVLDKAIDGEYSITLFHSVWTHEKDAAKRLAALKKEGPADSRYSFGCINVDKQSYKFLLDNYEKQMDGAKMFVVPDTPGAVMDFINGTAVARGDLKRDIVQPVVEKVTKTEPGEQAPLKPAAEEGILREEPRGGTRGMAARRRKGETEPETGKVERLTDFFRQRRAETIAAKEEAAERQKAAVEGLKEAKLSDREKLFNLQRTQPEAQTGDAIRFNLPWVPGGYEVSGVVGDSVYMDKDGREVSPDTPGAKRHVYVTYKVDGEQITNYFDVETLRLNTLGFEKKFTGLAARRKQQEDMGLTESDIYRIEQQLDMTPDPTFNELKTLTGALVYISESPNQLESELAARLLQDDNIDYVGETSFQVVQPDTEDVDPRAKEMLDEDAVGAYIPYTQGGSVFVRGAGYGRDQGINNEIVLHEAMHAIGAKKIAFVELAEKNDAPVPARLAEAVHQLRDLMDRTRDEYARQLAAGTSPSNLNRLAEAGAFTDIQEFYAYGMTDPDMKLFLRDSVPGTSTKTSGFDRFVEILMKLFGVDPKAKSGLKDLLLVSHEIMSAKKPSDKALAELTRKENQEIALKAKKQQSDEARVMRNLKAAQTAEEVVEQLGSLSSVAKNPALWGAWLKRNYTNMSIPAFKGFLYSMPTNVLIDIGTDKGIGSLKELNREVRNMSTFQHGRMREVENIIKDWHKVKVAEQKRLAEVMNFATDIQVDPDTDKSNAKLNAMWDKLTPEAKKVYRNVREFFKTSYNLYAAHLEKRVKDSKLKEDDKANLMAALRAMHETGSRLNPYFPLMRHGEYWVRIGKGDNAEFQMFDTPGDRDAYVDAHVAGRKKVGDKRSAAEMIEAGEIDKGNNIDTLRERILKQGGELSKIFDAIDALKSTSVDQKTMLKDEIFQMHLLTLPEGSFRKQFIHRKGKAGYSGDAMRNFAVAGTRMANQLGRVKYAPVLNNRVDAARASLALNPNKDRLDMIIDELNERIKEQIVPPLDQGWWPALVRTANRFAFVYALTTAKSAITNIFSLPVNTVPTLMKYFGAKDTIVEVTKFMALLPAQMGVTRVDAAGNVTYTAPSFGSSYLVRRNPELARAVRAMEEMGITHSTQTYDLWLAKRGKATTSKARQFTEGVVRVTGALFQGSERVIREVAFLSAFKLARKTMDFDDAVMKAVDVVNESLFDYSAWNTPRIMRSQTAKLLTQFKKFSLYTTIYYARNAVQMISPLKGETRRGAAYAFFGSMGLTGLTAGITNMFGVGFTMQMYGVLQAAWNMLSGGDDDDERKKMYELDFVRWFNNVYLPEMFGGIEVAGMDLAELMTSGVINTASGYDFASSVGVGNLWFRDLPNANQWDSAAANFAEYLAGPAVNIAGTMLKGVKDIMEGDVKKGLEKLMPIGALRGPMASWRMSEEGAVNKNLDVIKNADDFTKAQLFMQGLGYKTTGLAEVTNMNYYVAKAEREIESTRGGLIQQWVKAMRKGDSERVQSIQSDISKFNRMFPVEELLIEGDDLTNALESKMEKAATTERGLPIEEKFLEFRKLRQRGLDLLRNE